MKSFFLILLLITVSSFGTLMQAHVSHASATPTIIINDRLVYMTNSYEELTQLLNDELTNL